MAKYRTKECEIEAIQWNGSNMAEIKSFCKEQAHFDLCNLYIFTLEGTMQASVGDYIIKGVLGEFYPCKEAAFHMKYELI